MYTHKLSNSFKILRSWHQLKNLLFKKHAGTEDFNFQQVPLSSLSSYTNQSGGFYENWKQPKQELPDVAKEAKFKKWRSNWKSFITSEVGSFTKKADSGVSDIVLNLSNKTTEKIDYIQVKVLYSEESGKVYKSEFAEVFGVKPLSTVYVPVYDSPKGSFVNVFVTHVVAKAFGLEFCKNSYE